IIDPRQGVGPCLQANRVLFAVRISGIDGVDETMDIASATMKVLCLDRPGERQSKPEGCHSRHSPGEVPPEQSPSNCASLRFQGFGMRLQVLRSLFQDFESLTNIVHAVHVRILLWFVPAVSPWAGGSCLYVSVGGAARSGSVQWCAGVWCNA